MSRTGRELDRAVGSHPVRTGGLPPISCVPESFSDTMLVNGAPYPRLPVAPRRFRFRILNGCQARFLNLQLYVADSSPDGITLTSILRDGSRRLSRSRSPRIRRGRRSSRSATKAASCLRRWC